MDSLPLLSLITFVPALGGLLMAVARPSDQLVRIGTLATTLVTLALSVVLWMGFEIPASGQLAFVEDHPWIEPFGIRYHLGVDGIALSMILLTAILMPLAVLCSWDAIKHRVTGFFVSLLFLQTGMMGVFSAADLFVFYVFWEIMLIPMALLIGIWGGPRRVYAAQKFVIYTMAGSLLMFVAILYSYWVAAEAGSPTMEIAALQRVLPEHIGLNAQLWLFVAFSLSFAIKVPMFPFHTWLPDAHVEAPTAGSVILAGVLLKMGSYGFLRFAIPFFPEAAQYLAYTFMLLSAIGIVYGSFMSMVQTDIKKVIAYSSVAHLGFVMLGIFSGNVVGAQGAVLQMVNHGVSTGALFLLVGVVYERAHTRGVNDFGGLGRTMPVYAVLFLIVALSSIGLPGTNGFVGEFLILNGSFQTYPLLASLSALGVVLGAVYMLTLYRNMFWGEQKPSQTWMPDPDAKEMASLVPLVALIFVLGILPNTLLEITETPVRDVMMDLNPNAVTAQIVPPAQVAPSAAPAGGDHGHGGH
jgi:NADH-quinone oxidoreductase subunit M